MTEKNKDYKRLIKFVSQYTKDKIGVIDTSIPHLLFYRHSYQQDRTPHIYEPVIIFAIQGGKDVWLGGKRFNLRENHLLTTILPMSLECEVLQASEEFPVLGVAIRMELDRMAKIMFEMEKIKPIESKQLKSSEIKTSPIESEQLESLCRLVQLLKNPLHEHILSHQIIDEIYFKILNSEQGGYIKSWIRQSGSMKNISTAIAYIHDHLEEPISIEDLTRITSMSESTLHKRFKSTFQMSPLQYIKSLKFNRARALLLTGLSVSQVALQVGFSCTSQFSREFKKFYKISPSKISSL